jgi:hypothetical protein
VRYNRAATTRGEREEQTMAGQGQDPRGLYALISLAMVLALACDFVWVATTALHAMH